MLRKAPRTGLMAMRHDGVPALLQSSPQENLPTALYMAAAWARGEDGPLFEECVRIATSAPTGDIGGERIAALLGLRYKARALASFGWARSAVRDGNIAVTPVRTLADHWIVIHGDLNGVAIANCPVRGEISLPWSSVESSRWARAGEYGLEIYSERV